LGDQFKNNDLGGECRKRERERERMDEDRVWWRNLRESDHRKGLGLDWRKY
jgi:hypothetical protein